MKLSDKIAYVGRDIEDAIRLRFLTKEDIGRLTEMARAYDEKALNTTVIIHNMIYDICRHSSPEKGLCLSPLLFEQLSAIKEFNYHCIYRNKRLAPFTAYAKVVINQIFDVLLEAYRGEETVDELRREAAWYPELMGAFADWLSKFCDPSLNFFENLNEKTAQCANKKIYGRLETREIYAQAVLDYISGMSDPYALKVFDELITY